MAYAKSVRANWPIDEDGNPEPGWQSWEDYEGSLNMRCARCKGMAVIDREYLNRLPWLLIRCYNDMQDEDLKEKLDQVIVMLESMPSYD